MTDYLQFVITRVGIYKPAVPIIKEVMEKTGKDEILDLCSGSGGGIDLVQQELSKLTGKEIKVTLSDKYPNLESFEMLRNNSNEGLDYIKESVDAMHVPGHLKGIRTMFSSYHHFKPYEAKEILKNAANKKTPICIFEGAGKTIFDFLAILIFTPFIFLLITPFMKPFRLSRLFLTYIIPLVPVMTTWDGLVSILRMYTPKDMLKMANETGAVNYVWNAGEIKGKFANIVMYMVGYPKIR
jgi:hypothetical protein